MKKYLFAVMLLATTMLAYAQQDTLPPPPEGGNRPQRERPEGAPPRGDRPQGSQMTVEERAKLMTESMKEELKLTEAQLAPVDSINLLYLKAQLVFFQAARDGDLTREQVQESTEKLAEEKEKSLTPILTKKQMKAYREWIQERNRDRDRNRRQAPR